MNRTCNGTVMGNLYRCLLNGKIFQIEDPKNNICPNCEREMCSHQLNDSEMESITLDFAAVALGQLINEYTKMFIDNDVPGLHPEQQWVVINARRAYEEIRSGKRK